MAVALRDLLATKPAAVGSLPVIKLQAAGLERFEAGCFRSLNRHNVSLEMKFFPGGYSNLGFDEPLTVVRDETA